jgi:hypothetical protein
MMKEAADGLPETGEVFARLGARPTQPGRRGDVPAANPTDLVRPGAGGVSVAADSPDNLPTHMQPQHARYPVWEIDSADLGDGLDVADAGAPHHHVEAGREMTFAEFQALLAGTRTRWVRV